MALAAVGLTLLLAVFTGHAAVFAATIVDVSRADLSRMLRSLESPQARDAKPAAYGQLPPGGLEGTAWRAVDLAGMPVQAQQLPRDREPHLVFDVDGRVSGADGCNRITGSYKVNGNGLTFGPFAGTQMFCESTEKMTRRFQEALKGTSHWKVVAGRLELYGATDKPLAIFERRDPPSSAPTR